MSVALGTRCTLTSTWTKMASEEQAENISERLEGLEITVERGGTRAFLGEKCLGSGLLRITERELCWSGEGTDERLCLSYPDISLHAVSRDVSSFPHPCLFMLCSSPEEGDSDPDECPEQVEVRLVLENSDDLDTVFDAVSECQSFHPDPDLSTDSEDNEEDGGDDPVIIDSIESVNDDSGYFRTAEDLQYLSPEGQRTLEHLERLLATSEETKNGNGDANGQFEDAD